MDNGFSIFPEDSSEEEFDLYIYTPTFSPMAVNTKLLMKYLLGKLDEYELTVCNDDQTVHLVHENYIKYEIRVFNRLKINVFTEEDANIKYESLKSMYPKNIIELYKQDWIGNTLSYKWYKKFKYSNVSIRKPPPKITSLRKHPFKSYIL